MPTERLFQSSNNAMAQASRAGNTVEEIYEHILLRPDTYIGSIEKHTQTLWVYEDEELINHPVTYVPGLMKIFDEILLNAADNKQRDPSMNSVKVVIDVKQNLISVCNSGDGVPVEIHQEEGVYVPEMIFGHLLTSSNYDDDVKKTTGGRNGYGVKLTNIFSTEFTIETADGKRLKKFKQVFEDNMGKKSEPVIAKCKESENWTKVTFRPDLMKFNMTELENDVVALMSKRVFDVAGCLGKSVKVELNGKRIPVKSFTDYVDLYLKAANKSRDDPLPRMVAEVNDRWEVCVSLSDGQFQQVSFVNSIATIKGGTHVDYVTSQITNYIVGIVNKKNKTANMKPHNVKNHLWVFVNALIDNPAFDSEAKQSLTLPQSSFGSKCELSENSLKNVENLFLSATFKQCKELKKSDGSKTPKVQVKKLEDAHEAGGKNSNMCTLILTEGDSAKALDMAGLSVVGRDYYGVYPLCGKPLNGLGTNTSEEGIEYFENMKFCRRNFVWEDEQDGEAIEIAFSKRRIMERKTWISNFVPGTHLDQSKPNLRYSDFVNKELILFFIVDCQRSISSIVDGLKPSQRNILFCSLRIERSLDYKVHNLSGYVATQSAYHHGEQSHASTIIGMAQNYVGSNNVNLLVPAGQFGTRYSGGKDFGDVKYIHTRLSPITKLLFLKDDDVLLNYLNEDGLKVEPNWYMPIIPTVLVNGSEGIGTGWSTFIPNYNRRAIIDNIKHLLNKESVVPMVPWYRGFKGSIEKVNSSTYRVSGVYNIISETAVRIIELPIRKWRDDYIQFLDSSTLFQDYKNHGDNETIAFDVELTKENMAVVREKGLLETLKLTTTISTSNMHLFRKMVF